VIYMVCTTIIAIGCCETGDSLNLVLHGLRTSLSILSGNLLRIGYYYENLGLLLLIVAQASFKLKTVFSAFLISYGEVFFLSKWITL
jgi:hypothetical protein